jgi:hypothetical protein
VPEAAKGTSIDLPIEGGTMDDQTTELTDDQIVTATPGAGDVVRASQLDTDGTDADGTDGDAKDGTDGDAKDGTDGDAKDADGTDGDAKDARDGDATDADGTDAPS